MTNQDVAWAAGIYEGEGTCVFRRHGGIQVQVTQVDKWLPLKLQKMFGGSIWLRKRKCSRHNACHYWSIYGPRAVGFLLTIYALLSPRRRKVVKASVTAWNSTAKK